MLLSLLTWLTPLFAILLPIVSIFMILLILIQRGKGGGLVGAFGGAGGQSAFGAKAGDLFTKITIVVVCIWLAICIGLLLGMKHGANTRKGIGEGRTSVPITEEVPAMPSIPMPATE